MPGFVSHVVMARDVYDKLSNKKICLNDMLTYSLGGDLCKYAQCRYDSHHKYKEKFIYELANYIKENNLTDDGKVLGVLYGHICHYMMDDTLHPLIGDVLKKCVKHKANHTLMELYYDNYLVKMRYGLSKRKYLMKGILKSRGSREINQMIDYAYLNVYETDKVSKYYRLNLWLYRMLRNIYIIFGDYLVDRLIGLRRFIKHNRSVDMISDVDGLYKLSIERACEYIEKINKYLKI